MEVIGGYRLVRRIGAGGMGTVHEAVDAEGRRVAIKVLHPAIGADPAARERLRREVALLHRVRGAGVARVLDAEVEDVEPFIVTELIDGPTLEDRVQAHGPLDGDELSSLAHGLAEGLAAIHRSGVTHRDLKPGNVMLASRGPVIIDFGIAQVADDVRLTQTGLVTGTPGYLDPEVIDGANPGPGGDWWAWAAVLAYAATGRPPFGRGPIGAVLARVSTGAVDTEGLPEALAAALRASLDPDPQRRLHPDGLLQVIDGDWDLPALTQVLTTLGGDGYAPTAVPATSVIGEDPSASGTGMFPDEPPGPPTAYLPTYPGQPAPYPGQPGPYPAGPEPYPAGTSAYPYPGTGDPGTWGAGSLPDGQLGPAPAWALPPRRRTGTVLLTGVGITALAAPWPGGWAVALVALIVLLGTLGLASRTRRAARLRRGPRRGDTARSALATPWHLLRAVLAALPGVVLGAIMGAAAWWLATALVDPGYTAQPQLLWAGAALATLTAWSAPTTAAAREGARVVLAGVGRGGRIAVVVAALVGAAVVAVLLLGAGVGEPSWTPFPPPSLPWV